MSHQGLGKIGGTGVCARHRGVGSRGLGLRNAEKSRKPRDRRQHAGAANLSEPLVAHVRDLSTGEISLFNGTQEVIVRNPQLANQLARAAR